MNSKTYYEILQVTQEADPEVIEAAYRRLALKYHPDRNPGSDQQERMKQINEAYEVLRDPARRAEYDTERGVDDLIDVLTKYANEMFAKGADVFDVINGLVQKGLPHEVAVKIISEMVTGHNHYKNKTDNQGADELIIDLLEKGVHPNDVIKIMVENGWDRSVAEPIVMAMDANRKRQDLVSLFQKIKTFFGGIFYFWLKIQRVILNNPKRVAQLLFAVLIATGIYQWREVLLAQKKPEKSNLQSDSLLLKSNSENSYNQPKEVLETKNPILNGNPENNTVSDKMADLKREINELRESLKKTSETKSSENNTVSNKMVDLKKEFDELRESLKKNSETKSSDQFINSVGMKFKLVDSGTFTMGKGPDEDGYDDEKRRQVNITKPFYLGIYEATYGDIKNIYKTIPRVFPSMWDGIGLDKPFNVDSYGTANEICLILSNIDQEKNLNRNYRLPTEEEWEFACRAGTRTKFSFGNSLVNNANFENDRVLPIGSFPPNNWGFHDMHGNIAEITSSKYDGNNYVVKGGSFGSIEKHCRSAYRSGLIESRIGLRLVCEVNP